MDDIIKRFKEVYGKDKTCQTELGISKMQWWRYKQGHKIPESKIILMKLLIERANPNYKRVELPD